MDKRRTCYVEEVNENFEVMDKSSQFYNSDDVGVHLFAYHYSVTTNNSLSPNKVHCCLSDSR